MKKILIPTLLTIASTPLISLVGCGDPQPEPEPVYQEIEMTQMHGYVGTGPISLEKNTYYKFYCPHMTGSRTWENFGFEKDDNLFYPVKAIVIKVMTKGDPADWELSSDDLEWELELSGISSNIEIYIKTTIAVEEVVGGMYAGN